MSVNPSEGERDTQGTGEESRGNVRKFVQVLKNETGIRYLIPKGEERIKRLRRQYEESFVDVT